MTNNRRVLALPLMMFTLVCEACGDGTGPISNCPVAVYA